MDVDARKKAAVAVEEAAPSPPDQGFLASFPGPGLFVWGVWAALVLAAVLLIYKFGSPVPLWDDYLLFPQMTGAEPVTGHWLWASHYNHRIPLCKLVLVGLGRISHYNFLSGMYFNLAVLVVLSALFVQAAKVIRGHTSYADAFLPLLLLNFGHHRQVLWFWQVCYLLPMLLAGIIFYVILCHEKTPSFRSALVSGLCLVLLPLCGAIGLVFTPTLGLWLAVVGWRMWSSGGGQGRRNALAVFALVMTAFLLVVAYYANPKDLVGGAQPSGGNSPYLILRTTAQFLSTGLGHMTEDFFVFPSTAYVVIGLLALGGPAFLAVWYHRPESRLRSLGLFLFAVAEAVQALGVGYGRSGEGWDVDEGLQSRYVTLAAGALVGLYFVWTLFPYASVGKFFQMILFTLVCCLLPLNVLSCLREERAIRSQVASLENEMNAGVPPSFLTDRYWTWLYWLDNYQFKRERMAGALQNLHDAGVERFQKLRKDPAYQEILLPVAPAHADGIAGDITTQADASGPGSYLEYHLPEARPVYGIRIKAAFWSEYISSVESQVTWNAPGEMDFSNPEHQSRMSCEGLLDMTARPPVPRVHTLAFWVDGPVSQFRFYPSSQATAFRVLEISLVVPRKEEP